MHATLPLLEQTDFPKLHRHRVETIQVNLGYRCNQSCLHCHVNAGPTRKEEMTAKTPNGVRGALGRIENLSAAEVSDAIEDGRFATGEEWLEELVEALLLERLLELDPEAAMLRVLDNDLEGHVSLRKAMNAMSSAAFSCPHGACPRTA